MAKYAWTFSPDSGGKKIPDAVKRDITQRIEAHAAAHFAVPIPPHEFFGQPEEAFHLAAQAYLA